MNDNDELKFLEQVYSTYTVDTSKQTKVMRRLAIKTFKPYIHGESALELGCSDGFMTEQLSRLVKNLDVVDGSKNFLEKAQDRNLENVEFMYGLFETFNPGKKYDTIIASYILEHVVDPIRILKNARKLLKPDGRLFIVVPNARALSRQLALHMGLVPDLKNLTENDYNHGHRRVYDRVFLNRDIRISGLKVINEGGLMMKILADFQMDELFNSGFLTDEHVDGLYQLGLEYPDLCGSLYSVCVHDD
jgi:2-polyprenyl-3-methyl-5-hydroxy-6-metoxy-1,4-benzoquinol methylase